MAADQFPLHALGRPQTSGQNPVRPTSTASTVLAMKPSTTGPQAALCADSERIAQVNRIQRPIDGIRAAVRMNSR